MMTFDPALFSRVLEKLKNEVAEAKAETKKARSDLFDAIEMLGPGSADIVENGTATLQAEIERLRQENEEQRRDIAVLQGFAADHEAVLVEAGKDPYQIETRDPSCTISMDEPAALEPAGAGYAHPALQ